MARKRHTAEEKWTSCPDSPTEGAWRSQRSECRPDTQMRNALSS